MIKSMTGFGRFELAAEERKITVEIKAVNHRYCDLSIKMPKKLGFFEAGIRNLLKQYIQRGKVDVYITYEDYTENKACVKYNEDIAREYFSILEQMSSQFGLENDIKISSLSRYPEILTLEEQTVDEDALWKSLEEVIRGAARKFVETRIAEGENLRNDIYAKLDSVLADVAFIEERSPLVVDEYRERLTNKVKELLGDTKLDQSVLATEITIFADKICVDEETVRLKSHVANTKATLQDGENIGRKLDFIAQEMNREANTILSKSSDLEITNRAIDLKTEIEKIREQIQNIE
ncbi:YicC/YloC family endoribonuclease [Anaerolentibacter hominis]|uniref:YicC/YloC family endoribonuclease n=1 Tax=Anaerolentibacter hominis TaxID=3079009 RepID=UPI0031B87A86